jgi:nucleotide-binding universal stress UspA family protein
LSTLLAANLTVDAARQVERDVLHDPEPAEALVALSASASLLVVGMSSDRPAASEAPGSTTRAILGRTRCPVVVVPGRRVPVTGVAW